MPVLSIFKQNNERCYPQVNQFDPNSEQFWSKFNVYRCPGDGHCLIHALTETFNRQATLSEEFNEYMFLEAIRRETVTNCVYDSKYGDLVLLVAANALSINTIIVSKTDNCYSSRIVQSSHESGTNQPSVMVLKTGDHYDALVPNDQLNFISENCDINVSGVHLTNYDNAVKV